MSLVALSLMASCASDTPSETSQAESIGSEAATTPDSGSSEQPTMPNETAYDGVFPQHEPYGTGIGAMPGRVVWTHDPDSVEWDGEGYWWELAHFDEERIIQMVERGIASLAGEEDVVSGWERLFTSHNTSRGRQDGYQPGQKIAIKTNMNGSGAYGDDQHGETRESYTNPVLLRALLLSLVEDAGVWAALGRLFLNLYEIFKISAYDNHIRNYLPDDGKRKKPSFSRHSSCHHYISRRL